MLGMSRGNGADARWPQPRVLMRPRYWTQARAENPLARFVPFSSLVSPHDVITRGGDYLRVWRLDGVPFECADEHVDRRAARGAVQPAAQPGRRPVGGVDASPPPQSSATACRTRPSPASRATCRGPTTRKLG